MRRDKRLQPRHNLKFPVALSMGDAEGSAYKTESVNISRNALELRCNSEVMAAFMAQNDYPQTCYVTFRLPEQGIGFAIHCQLLTYRRLSQHLYHTVLGFSGFDEGCAELLADCLSQSSLPSPVAVQARAAFGRA